MCLRCDTNVTPQLTAKEAALKDAALQRDRADVDLIKEFGKAGKFFSTPLMPIAGATHTLFFNRAWGQFYDSKRRETVLIVRIPNQYISREYTTREGTRTEYLDI
jgi:hypothetical protein